MDGLFANRKNCLGYEFKHFTINWSEHFVYPSTGVYRQSIESLWAAAKRRNKMKTRIKKSLSVNSCGDIGTNTKFFLRLSWIEYQHFSQ